MAGVVEGVFEGCSCFADFSVELGGLILPFDLRMSAVVFVVVAMVVLLVG